MDQQKRGGGRRKESAALYADELGISKKHLFRVGGEAYLRSLSPDIRALMLKPFANGNSQTVMKGGLRARGMRTRIPGRLTQSQPA